MTTIILEDGTEKQCDRITELDSGWIRCVSDETSPREELPETTKYYDYEDVVRIE